MSEELRKPQEPQEPQKGAQSSGSKRGLKNSFVALGVSAAIGTAAAGNFANKSKDDPDSASSGETNALIQDGLIDLPNSKKQFGNGAGNSDVLADQDLGSEDFYDSRMVTVDDMPTPDEIVDVSGKSGLMSPAQSGGPELPVDDTLGVIKENNLVTIPNNFDLASRLRTGDLNAPTSEPVDAKGVDSPAPPIGPKSQILNR